MKAVLGVEPIDNGCYRASVQLGGTEYAQISHPRITRDDDGEPVVSGYGAKPEDAISGCLKSLGRVCLDKIIGATEKGEGPTGFDAGKK